jgi:osmotically-inducible protein OsmY
MTSSENHSIPDFEQDRWGRPHKSKREEFQELIDDNEVNDDIFEFDLHENDYTDQGLSRIHTDQELERVVKELLHNSQKLDGKDISVSVDNCNVTLSGTVKSQEERDYATDVVKLVHGVGEVHSEIIVKRNPGILPTDIGRHA